jgi:hypothetical protein
MQDLNRRCYSCDVEGSYNDGIPFKFFEFQLNWVRIHVFLDVIAEAVGLKEQ